MPRAHRAKPPQALESAGAVVEEVELPDLFDHLVATSMYTDRSKHDLDRFLAELATRRSRTSRRPTSVGQYDQRLDLMDAIMDGPDDPDSDRDYLARFAARHEFALIVTNVMAPFDALAYPSVQVPPPTLEGRADWTTLTLPTNTLIASQTWLPAITVPAGADTRERAGRPRACGTPVRRSDALPARLWLRGRHPPQDGAGAKPRRTPLTGK